MQSKLKIKNKFNKEAKGQNPDALANSRVERKIILGKVGDEYQDGGVPQSILIANRKHPVIDFFCKEELDGGGCAGMHRANYRKMTEKGHKQLKGTAMKATGRNKKNVISKFPQNIGRIVLNVYCPDKGIVYDPHAGHNSRMQLCFENDRNYVGVDVSAKFMEANRRARKALYQRRKSTLNLGNNTATIKLIEGSSDKVDLPDNYADFTLTSPPYWDIEYYGDEPEQLGNAKTYQKFLSLLLRHIKENFRILKPGAFICYFINDFRKKGKFYSYHSDCIKLFQVAGFEQFNTYIVDIGWPVNAAFAQDIVKKKILPKRHEYCLVFQKPE